MKKLLLNPFIRVILWLVGLWIAPSIVLIGAFKLRIPYLLDGNDVHEALTGRAFLCILIIEILYFALIAFIEFKIRSKKSA